MDYLQIALDDASNYQDKCHPEILNPPQEIHSKYYRKYKLRKWSNYILKSGQDCEYCGSLEDLNAHHLFSKSKNPKLTFSKNNGIILCKTCHLEHHSLNGRFL